MPKRFTEETIEVGSIEVLRHKNQKRQIAYELLSDDYYEFVCDQKTLKDLYKLLKDKAIDWELE